jgi:hypothetical protein
VPRESQGNADYSVCALAGGTRLLASVRVAAMGLRRRAPVGDIVQWHAPPIARHAPALRSMRRSRAHDG